MLAHRAETGSRLRVCSRSCRLSPHCILVVSYLPTDIELSNSCLVRVARLGALVFASAAFGACCCVARLWGVFVSCCQHLVDVGGLRVVLDLVRCGCCLFHA